MNCIFRGQVDMTTSRSDLHLVYTNLLVVDPLSPQDRKLTCIYLAVVDECRRVNCIKFAAL
jgi:hypothetical protein